eukprot:TRINITY_DN2437_c0_g1_i1.p1 TRINITY_DN2437_c0_g1~~TRINITY_DN2437_c0_g1_i1.p1  ORF type:complete len:486 (+),score=158.12 TRINITY_DN2437_c0_g1_i1:111-1568(+)
MDSEKEALMAEVEKERARGEVLNGEVEMMRNEVETMRNEVEMMRAEMFEMEMRACVEEKLRADMQERVEEAENVADRAEMEVAHATAEKERLMVELEMLHRISEEERERAEAEERERAEAEERKRQALERERQREEEARKRQKERLCEAEEMAARAEMEAARAEAEKEMLEREMEMLRARSAETGSVCVKWEHVSEEEQAQAKEREMEEARNREMEIELERRQAEESEMQKVEEWERKKAEERERQNAEAEAAASHGRLKRCDLSPDPLAQVRAWVQEVGEGGREGEEHTRMCLSTVNAHGVPSARMVLMKRVDDDGIVFFTNYESRKSHELKENPFCACVFYWPTMNWSIRIQGRAHMLAEDESDRYFASRARRSQVGSHASRQSQPISSIDQVLAAVDHVDISFQDREVPRPSRWGGWKIVPFSIEFWQSGANRLHDRFEYRREVEGKDGAWLDTFSGPGVEGGSDANGERNAQGWVVRQLSP